MVKIKSGCRKKKGVGYSNKIYRLLPIACLIACCLSPVAGLYAYSQLGYNNFGDPVTGFTARSVGMGSTDITAANDSAALASNPAALLNTTAKKLIVSISPGYNLFEERRNVADIDNVYTNLRVEGAGAASYLYFGNSDYFNRLIAGIHYHPVSNMAYEFTGATVAGTLSDNTSIDSAGGMNELDIGFGAEIIKEVYAGFAYGMLSGENSVKLDKAYYNNNALILSYTDETKKKFDGSCIRYGLMFTELDYSLGMFYQPSASVTAKTSGDRTFHSPSVVSASLSSELEANLPEKFGVGFSYRFKDSYRTLFAVDFLQQDWNAFTSTTTAVGGVATGNVKQNIAGYSASRELKIGFQHWLNDLIPVRYGFRYQQFYQTWDNRVLDFYHTGYVNKREAPTFYCISLGTGYVVGYFDIDFGYEFGRRNYTTSSERYDEFLQKFALTGRYRW